VSYERSGSLATLRQRAAILAAIRSFFAAHGVLEVETPALSPAGVTDPAIESLTASARSLGRPHYLQTSPEFAMKRLLAAGSGDIYQICRVYRDDELGRWHHPEFDVVASALAAAGHATPARVVRLTYAQALHAALGAVPTAPTRELAALLAERGVDVPAGLTHDAVLDLAFGTLVAASFDAAALTLVYDYPASQAALARLKPTAPPVAARFEAFSGGVELANGFHELKDGTEQRRRFVAEREARLRQGRHAPPLDEQLLQALPSLPDCAGVALGVDRLVALALGEDNVAAALSFAHRRD
jgi:elongation factor P--(R)-beta-lysine ligase